MTLLTELTDAASGDAIPVATLLRKVKVLASRAQVAELGQWVDHELTGYGADAPLPPYRGPFKVTARGDFGGPFGSGLRNAPIPEARITALLDADWMFKTELRDSVGELADLLVRAGSDTPRHPWPTDMVGYLNGCIQNGSLTIYRAMMLQQAWTDIPTTTIAGVLDNVRTRVLDLALGFERQAPSAGEADAEPADLARAQTIVTNIFGSVANLAVASTDVSQSALPAAGHLEDLLDLAKSLGVAPADLDALRDAGSEPDSAQRVERTQSWLGRFILNPASAVVLGASGDLLSRAIASFLGAPFAA